MFKYEMHRIYTSVLLLVLGMAYNSITNQKQTDKDPEKEQPSQQHPEGVIEKPSMPGRIPPTPPPCTCEQTTVPLLASLQMLVLRASDTSIKEASKNRKEH